MFDLLIRGGKVVMPSGTGEWDVGVENGKIAAITVPNAITTTQAGRILNARNRIVIPGGIDPHIHCNWLISRDPHGGPPTLSAGPDQVSRAALFGGTTTLIDFAVWDGQETL